MKKGFTLIELLIVIAILAILTTTVVLVLNPAGMLAKARDSQRMADLDSLRSAINLYLATYSVPTLVAGPISQGGFTGCMALTGTCTTTGASLIYLVDGTGWVGVNLGLTPSGSPLAVLPRDPTGSTAYHYAYKGDDNGKTFALNAVLESAENATKMVNDGGLSTSTYEIGTHSGVSW
jgi:prepilin-type N-terminal cleavage/methylation domain-containing protein